VRQNRRLRSCGRALGDPIPEPKGERLMLA
jgi:hypothetical protein